MRYAHDYEFLCVGSGPAGQRAAVVERGHVIGGVCVDTGTIPSKTFREAVLSLKGQSVLNSEQIRSGPVLRPTAEELFARVAKVEQLQSDIIIGQLRRNDVTVLTGEASFKDAHTVVIVSDHGPTMVTADNILIAVGTTPAPPPGVSTEPNVVVTSDELLQLTSLPRRLAVVGAGVIGIEYASMFAALGIEVTLIDKRDRPLEFLDREIVDELLSQMRNNEVTFRLGEAVDRLEIVEGPPRRVVMFLESGKRLVSELVLFCAGRQGATAQLNLPAAGLKADDRGRLTVDGEYRTTVPHIFAAGDVIGYPQPGDHLRRTGTAGSLLRVWGGSQAYGPLSHRHLCHSRNINGWRDGAGVDRSEGSVRNRHSALSGDRAGPHPRRRQRPVEDALSSRQPSPPWRTHHRDRRNRIYPHRASGTGARRRAGLFLDDGLQLSDLGRVLQGGRAGCL